MFFAGAEEGRLKEKDAPESEAPYSYFQTIILSEFSRSR